jgi:hypothetical protein
MGHEPIKADFCGPHELSVGTYPFLGEPPS